jgi:hypothetical protein
VSAGREEGLRGTFETLSPSLPVAGGHPWLQAGCSGGGGCTPVRSHYIAAFAKVITM